MRVNILSSYARKCHRQYFMTCCDPLTQTYQFDIYIHVSLTGKLGTDGLDRTPVLEWCEGV